MHCRQESAAIPRRLPVSSRPQSRQPKANRLIRKAAVIMKKLTSAAERL